VARIRRATGMPGKESPLPVPETFWELLAEAPHALLAVDYDGTLAPHHAPPDEAVPYAGMRDLLERIRDEGRTRLVVITRRAPDQVARLLSLDPVPEIWGSLGWEQLRPDGVLERQPLPVAAERALEAAERAAREAGWSDDDLERRYDAVILRCTAPADAPDPSAAHARLAAARAVLTAEAAGNALNFVAVPGGVAVRAAGWNKGRALAQVLAAEDPGAAAAYLGDDSTSEDAFAVLAEHGGLPLLVADEDRPTAAAARLTPPEQLRAFLTRWLDTRRRITT
jgi:trehalose-phosphatase